MPNAACLLPAHGAGGAAAGRRLGSDDSAAERGVELELKRRGLERLVGRARAAALGPVRADIVRPARSLADSSVQRLNRETTVRVAGDERMEAPAEPVDLDDVSDLDALEPQRAEVTSRFNAERPRVADQVRAVRGRGGLRTPALETRYVSG